MIVVAGAAMWAIVIPAVTTKPTLEDQPVHPRIGRVASLVAARADFPFATVSELIDAVEPAVVQIETRTAVGSGFVLDAAGLIVTCCHCVDGEVSARVVFADKKTMKVVGVRALSPGRDLAILEVNTVEPLPCLGLADILPRKGEPIVSFGSPAGLSFTFSEGSISAHRTVEDIERIAAKLRGGGRLDLARQCGLVQFTATSMPGHSGGPVVDWRGNVVGVTSFGLPFEGRSFEFAISAVEIRNLAAQLNDAAIPLKEMWPEETPELPEFGAMNRR